MAVPRRLAPPPRFQQITPDGTPAVGYQLFSYITNTTTKSQTYQGANGAPNTNPIVLDSYGSCALWLDPDVTYTLVLAPPDDTDPPTSPIWTVNDVDGSL